MKKIIAILVALVVMMMSVAALADVPADWTTLALPDIQCHFSVPGDMVIGDADPEEGLAFTGENDSILLEIYVFPAEDGMTIEDFAASMAEELGEGFQVALNCIDSLDYKHAMIMADDVDNFAGFAFLGADDCIYYMQAATVDADGLETFGMIIGSLVDD